MDYQAKPSSELKRLDFLIGQWQTEGSMKTDVADELTIIKGTDSYEWVSGGFFLLHKVNVQIGLKKVEAVELIGYDHIKDSYILHSFDNEGNIVSMTAAINEDGVLLITGDEVRSMLIVSMDNKHMTAYWETFKNGDWQPWMDMKFNK